MIKITIFLLTFCLSVSAKTDRVLRTIFLDAPKSSPKSVTLYIAKESQVERSRSLLPKGESMRVNLFSSRLSRPTTIPSGALVAWVLDKEPDPDVGIPVGAQKINLPANWSRIGLVFTNDSENKIFPAKVIPINLSSGDFKPGDIMFYNLSSNGMVGQFGSTKLSVESMSYKIIQTPPTDDTKSYPVKVDCILASTKERRPIVRSTWLGLKSSRVIQFMLDTKNKSRPRIFGVRDKS